MGDFFEALCALLVPLARLAGGYAMALDLESNRQKTVDEEGREMDGPPGGWEGLEEAIKAARPLLVSSGAEDGVQYFYLPTGGCLLAVNNRLRARREGNLKEVFREALPLIARVAGGEAVLFDRRGLRFCSVGPDGRETPKGMGEYTHLGRRAMELGRPVIGPSLLEEGALAVRIPVTGEFGLGFNNVLAVRQKKALAASRQGYHARYTFADIVGNSPAIRQCIQQARQVAATDSTVLLCGETGTGKELFAQAIHHASRRSRGPFVALNCGAIPATLVESQLFGYEAGAFTGASRSGQPGVFEQAHGGTLFLDEISEMELEMQSRLLRVLQEREVVRIGGKKAIAVDVRIIASTNKDLWQLVASGRFRQDLYYRLNVVDLRIPPLRERIEDIPLLIHHFMERFRRHFATFVRDISGEALECLMRYPWPGNVRELQNCIERVMNLCTREVIQPEDLPAVVRDYHMPAAAARAVPEAPPFYAPGLKGATRAMERAAIMRALQESGYSRRRAAEKLGISVTTLWRKMKKLGIYATEEMERNLH
ncbi:sigma-54 interaction domain-containing protein [Desulfovirgula thermocuniculi]|uniref:sigma-54 interaction domain-containing protein n=1 Tax=Desulfovirgula thermocuniculi TaxID=348842 RepID=UPI00040D059A|nr:sigma 54-interacting transcriptional regulator [Desulfovirgula thermocuniculi]